MMTGIAQFVRRRYLRAARPGGGGGRRLAARVWLRLERALAKAGGDPAVTHQVGAASIRLPISHALPRIMLGFPDYNTNLGRVGAAVARKYPQMTAVDVGANVGDTIAFMRADADYPILCVEAHDRFFELLRDNAARFDHVTIARAYLGDADAAVGGRLSVAHGTANLAGAGPATADAVRVRTLDSLLAEFPAFAGAKLLKSDTDGYDNKILRGAAALLARARPAVFFEYDPHFLALQGDDGLSIFPFLRDLGYRRMLVYENTGPLAGTIDLSDDAALAEMHRANTGHRSFKYVDLCAFHADDLDLFDQLARSEAARRQRRGPDAAAGT
jgi:FkbM family methyltransferase